MSKITRNNPVTIKSNQTLLEAKEQLESLIVQYGENAELTFLEKEPNCIQYNGDLLISSLDYNTPIAYIEYEDDMTEYEKSVERRDKNLWSLTAQSINKGK